jgi:hypothetical protein
MRSVLESASPAGALMPGGRIYLSLETGGSGIALG